MSLFGAYETRLTPRIRELVWERDNNTCQRCGKVSHYTPRKGLLSEGWDPYMVVHHIDKNRGNNSLENLKLVCPTCHVKEHGKEWGKTGRGKNQRRALGCG